MPLLSPRTKNTYLQAAMSFSRWLVRNKRLEDDPLSAMQLANEDVDVRRARASLTDEQFTRLFIAAQDSQRTVEGFDGPTRAMAYLISVSTGLRRSELASLTPESFHLGGHDPSIVLQAAFSKHRRRDVVPVPKSIVQRLQKWLAKMSNDRPVFAKLGQRKTHKMVAHDLAAAGIPSRTRDGRCRDWHALRHTFVTRAWRSGATANLVRTLARHSDLRETMRYSHAMPAELRVAVDLLPPLLPESDSTPTYGEIASR
jgi:integrase